MKAWFKVGGCLALALAPSLSLAQELQWRPAGNASAPASGVVSVGLSRPVPLDDPAAPAVRPVVRGQSPEEPRPLPPGPPTGAAAVLGPPSFTPFNPTQLPGQPVMPKAGEFVAPAPQTPSQTAPPANVWGPPVGAPLPGFGGGDACAPACPSACCSTGLLSHLHLFDWLHRCPDPCCTTACPPCPDLCSNACNPCSAGNRPRYWLFADYLVWVPQNQGYPPLVTASLNGGTGVLGAPGTVVLFNRFNDPAISGMRIGGGAWFHNNSCWGVDANYWFLSGTSRTAAFGNAGDPNIGRPFFDIVNGVPKAEIVSFLGAVVGGVSVNQTQQIWGMEANLRRKLAGGDWGWLDLQMGYRHFNLNESLQINENLLAANPAPLPSTQFLLSDRFHTNNSFNAPQLGIASLWYFAPRWSLYTNVRLAMGVVSQTVDISGNTIISLPGFGSFVGPGGLLTQPSNIGSRTLNRFAVMPELNLKLGYDLTPNLRVYAGYDFMYISSVVRPTGQIDLNVNRFQVFTPPPFGAGIVNPAPFPAARFHPQDMWLQGLNCGIQYRY
jgi:hypothetical protein